MVEPKISTFLSILGPFIEKYVPAGYHNDMKLEEKLEKKLVVI